MNSKWIKVYEILSQKFEKEDATILVETFAEAAKDETEIVAKDIIEVSIKDLPTKDFVTKTVLESEKNLTRWIIGLIITVVGLIATLLSLHIFFK